MYVALWKYLYCVVDKTIDTGHTTSTDCNTKYKVILLMMLFKIYWCTSFKTDL